MIHVTVTSSGYIRSSVASRSSPNDIESTPSSFFYCLLIDLILDVKTYFKLMERMSKFLATTSITVEIARISNDV